MTSETPQPSTPEPTPGPPGGGGMDGQSLVFIGALLSLGTYLVFELILDEYFQFVTTLVAAALIVLVTRVGRPWLAQLAPVPVLVKALGYTLAVSGAFDLLGDLRFGRLDDAVSIIGGLVAYAGFVLAFIGARSIQT